MIGAGRAKQSRKTSEEEMCVALAVLQGEASDAEAVRKAGMSEQTESNRKRAFRESRRAGLDAGRARRMSRELEAENEDLKAALGQDTLSFGSGRMGPSISSDRGPRDNPHRSPVQFLQVR